MCGLWREKLFGENMVKNWDFGANYWGDGVKYWGDVWAIIGGMGVKYWGMYPLIPPGFAALQIAINIPMHNQKMKR